MINSPARMQTFSKLAWFILKNKQVKKATKYFSETEVLKATYQGKKDGRDRTGTILFTFGRPNYQERKFIKLCKKAGEPFPVKSVQLKFFRNGK